MEAKNISCLDIISKYMQLEKRGNYYFGCCPFHSEKTPSFVVNPEKNFWKCYGCGKGGDAAAFVAEYKNISYREALEEIEKETGYELVKKKEDPFKLERRVLEIARDLYHKILVGTKTGEKPLEYLLSRGITKEQIEERKIGYCSLESGEILKKVLKEMNLDHVNVDNLYNKNHNAYFHDRIVIPVLSERGICGFVGRALDNEVKYLNQKESKIFERNDFIFNLNTAKHNLGDNKEVVVVEGIFDVLALERLGKKNVVCSLGTSVSYGQVQKLVKNFEEITIFFDGDAAGVKGTLKLYEKIKKENHLKKINIISNPTKLDPDELVKTNQIKLINKISIFEMIANSALSNKEKEDIIFDLCSYEQAFNVSEAIKLWSNKINVPFEIVFEKYEKHNLSSEKADAKFLLKSIVKGFEDKNSCLAFSPFINKNMFPNSVLGILRKMFIYFKTHDKFNLNEFSKSLTEDEAVFVSSLEGKKFYKIKFALSEYYSLQIFKTKAN